MRRRALSILIAFYAVMSYGQSPSNSILKGTELGLHGKVIWLSDTKISVEYDWTNTAQLLDWTPTHGSNLVIKDGSLTISGGSASVRSMIWKQLIKCTRIHSENAVAINSPRAHLNFVTNVIGWDGYYFKPPEIIGIIYVADGNYWLEDGTQSSLSSPSIVEGSTYSTEMTVSDTEISTRSSSDNALYTYTLHSPPDFDRQVALGGWEGDTKWGKVTIEGELNPQTLNWQTPEGMINIRTCGSSFSPVIQVTGNPTIEWIFDDNTTSASPSPVKDYGTIGVRNNLLKVTPWTALIGINLGYDAADGGYGGFATVPAQNIFSIQNLSLSGNSLQYLCAEYSPIYELDLQGFTSLKNIEFYLCHNLSELKLTSNSALERLCIEECNLDSLDISGCTALKDLRAADNRYTSLKWGTIGLNLWHICVRSNPQLEENLPDLTRFPALKELLTWDDNQTGAFICHNQGIDLIDSHGNHYVAADISGCNNLTQLSLSGSKLNSLNLGTADYLNQVSFKDCWLGTDLTDYVLSTIDVAGRTGGYLDLSGNAPPSSQGITHRDNLVGKGWTVIITDPGQNIPVSQIEISSESGNNSITSPGGTLHLTATVLPGYSTNSAIHWSVQNGSGVASVTPDGVVTAISDGKVTVIATADDGSGVAGRFDIIISGQPYSESDHITTVISGNELRIILDSNYITWRASLYDFSGKQVLTKFVDSDIVRFDITSLPPGIMIVLLEKGNNLKVAKVLIP